MPAKSTSILTSLSIYRPRDYGRSFWLDVTTFLDTYAYDKTVPIKNDYVHAMRGPNKSVP